MKIIDKYIVFNTSSRDGLIQLCLPKDTYQDAVDYMKLYNETQQNPEPCLILATIRDRNEND